MSWAHIAQRAAHLPLTDRVEIKSISKSNLPTQQSIRKTCDSCDFTTSDLFEQIDHCCCVKKEYSCKGIMHRLDFCESTTMCDDCGWEQPMDYNLHKIDESISTR